MDVVAKNFGAWCKRNYIITRGYVRIGTHKKSGLRGLIAAKNIPVDESIVAVPTVAMISFVTSMRDQTFTSMFLQNKLPLPITKENMTTKLSGTFVHRTHMVLAMHMTHCHLSQDYERHDYMWYFDFLPRGEGNFGRLSNLLTQIIDSDAECQEWLRVMGQRHHVKPDEVRDMMIYFLTMIFSRSLPIDHFATVGKLLEGSEFIEQLRQDSSLAIPCMCPVLDMCNHHPRENAAVMVPDTPMKEARVVMVRSTQPIPEGEEILLTYGSGKMEELGLIYGIDMAK